MRVSHELMRRGRKEIVMHARAADGALGGDG
jgi:hypothetical protein